MNQRSTFLVLILMCSALASEAQCYSRKGVMNESCASLTIIMPPALEVSVGMNNYQILKADVNYITQDNIVYGGSVGIRPFKGNGILQEDAMVNGFLGYNLAGCVILGATVGATHIPQYSYVQYDRVHVIQAGFKTSVGMSVKFISTFTHWPIVFGAYGSNAGFGFTLGTIF